MPLPEPYRTNLPLIGSRIIAIESQNPGLVRMRITPDATKVSAAVADLKALGFKKPFLQSGQQFIYDCVLSYPKAIEMWLPFSELHSLDKDGCVQIWFGYGRYCGWQGVLPAMRFDAERGKRMLLIFEITPFYAQLSDLLDPIKQKT